MKIALTRINELLIHGSVEQARAEIDLLCRGRVSRAHLAPLANLARRACLPERSLRLLHGIVRPPADVREHTKPPSDLEKAEYAGALIYVGANDEALRLLQEVDRQQHPIAEVLEAFARARVWDFEGALVPLRRHAGNPNVSEIGRLRGRVEVANALAEGRGDTSGALAILESLLSETGPNTYRVIYKDALLLSAQCHLFQKRWQNAHTLLERLREVSAADQDTVFLLQTDKWQYLLELARDPGSSVAVEGLRLVRDRLAAAWRYEDARSCDFYEALFRQNDRLFARLYFGTPYRALKERIRKHMGHPERLDGEYEWPIVRGSAPEITLNAADGVNTQDRARLRPGDLPQRLLRGLALDFYRPLHAAELFARLYPGEYFNPDSSPDKLHQALRRLRRWLTDARLPLEIVEHASFYRLRAALPVAIRVRELAPDVLRESSATSLRAREYAARLARVFADREFTAFEATGALGISARTMSRYLASLRDQGLVMQRGSGGSVAYRLAA